MLLIPKPKYLTSGNLVQRYDDRPQEISCLWCAFDTYCIRRKPSSFGVNDEFVVRWDNGIGDLTVGTVGTILIFGENSFNSSTWNMRKQKQMNNPLMDMNVRTGHLWMCVCVLHKMVSIDLGFHYIRTIYYIVGTYTRFQRFSQKKMAPIRSRHILMVQFHIFF